MYGFKEINFYDCKNYTDTPTSLDNSLKESRGQLLNAMQHQPTFLPVEHLVIALASVIPSTAHRVIT
jgi:hypothetical protein